MNVHWDDVPRYKVACAQVGASALTDLSIDRTFSLTRFDPGLQGAQLVIFSGPAGSVRKSFFLIEQNDHSLSCGGLLGSEVVNQVLLGAFRYKNKVLLLGQVVPPSGSSPVFVELTGESSQSGNSVSASQIYSVYGGEFVSEGLLPAGTVTGSVTKVCVIYHSTGLDAVGYGETDCDKHTAAQVPFDIGKSAVEIQ
jgi:hypothetical protein